MTVTTMTADQWKAYRRFRAAGQTPVGARTLATTKSPEYEEDGDQAVTLTPSDVPAGLRVRVTWEDDDEADVSLLGKFTDKWEPGVVVANKPGSHAGHLLRYFLPSVTAAEQRRELWARGYSRGVAGRLAESYVRRDMEMARTPTAVSVRVEVVADGPVPLGMASIHEVFLSDDEDTVDQVLDVVEGHSLVTEALAEARATLGTLADPHRESVTWWADSFGRWHVKVAFPGRGYGPDTLQAEGDRIRAKARRAMRREISARQTVGPGWRCAIEVAENDLDHMNVMRSITYREKAEG